MAKKTPREEYLRKRFAKVGANGFMPRDGLELILGYCLSGPALFDLINALFDRYQDPSNIFEASYEELMRVRGMTSNIAVLLSIIRPISEIMNSMVSSDDKIATPRVAFDFFRRMYSGVKVEQFKIVCIDKKFMPYSCFTAARGTTFGVDINTDRIIDMLRQRNCTRCIAAHNHPGGSCMPTKLDAESTRCLAEAFARRGIELLDHIIIGTDGEFSMARQPDEPYPKPRKT